MEVKEASAKYSRATGYKLTEAGIIPDDWETYTIGNSMRLINGRAFKPEDWKEHGLPIIRIQNLNDTEAAFNYFSGPVEDRHRIEAGDLLFAWSGTTGTSFGARVWNGPTGVLNQHIFKVIPDQKKLTIGYALLVLRKVQEQIEKQSHGFKASFVHVKKSDLISVQLPFPPTKAEQVVIADVLSDAESLIESLEQLVAKKRHLKLGTMQQLLTGKKRLPGFSGGWEVKTVGGLGDCFAGGTPSTFRPEYWGGEICWLPSGRVQNCILDHPSENETRITKRGLNESAAKLIKPRSVLVAITGATCANVACLEFEASANQSVVAIEPNSTVNYRFVYYSLLMERNAILSLQSGSAQGGVNLKTIKSIPLRLPPYPEQTAIAAILSDMDAEITALEEKLAKARAIKQGMMQELLTGRIRLV